MKRLIVLVGPNGVGKSTTAQCLLEQHAKTAYVDSDWCRLMNPFAFSDITLDTVSENIYFLLRNYLSCPEISTVIFTHSWHGPRKMIYDRVIEKLGQDGIVFQETILILKCSREENVRRAIGDHRDAERVQRGIASTYSFYDAFDYPLIDTTNMTPSQVAEKISRLCCLD